MTATDLQTILDKLAGLAPSSRTSAKRQLLESASDAILALHRRGHSWRALARELSSAIGETVSADLLRAACIKQSGTRKARRIATSTLSAPSAQKPPVPPAAPTSSSGGFGAKGLKL